MIVGLRLWGVCMLLTSACSVVAYIATVAPSREWNTQNGGVRPPVFFYTVVESRLISFIWLSRAVSSSLSSVMAMRL